MSTANVSANPGSSPTAFGGRTVHHIDVALVETKKGLEVIAPCKNHKVDAAAQGDVVEWHFHNRSKKPMAMAIGKFSRHSKARCTVPSQHSTHQIEPVDLQPIDFQRATVNVKAGGKTVLVGTIKRGTLVPRTYKYAILGNNGNVLLDPEIEIEK